MSTARSGRNALKHVASVASAAKSANVTSKPRLFLFQWDPSPDALNNPLIYGSTKEIAADPSHPLHLRIKRRRVAFDANKLHWTVKGPMEFSKKAIVRKWAIRRTKEAFRQELHRMGWNKDGEAIRGRGGRSLKGALCVWLTKDAAMASAEWKDVRSSCSWLLRKVIGLQQTQDSKQIAEKERNVTSIRSPAYSSGAAG